MSAVWRLKQARWLLNESRNHVNTFGSREYEYLVVAVLDAHYGTLGLLRREYSDCAATNGERFEDWYGNRVRTQQNDETTLLGFFFKKNTGIRSRLSHQDVPPISAKGVRHIEEGTDIIIHEQTAWYFQEMALRAQRVDAPSWVSNFARTVDELLEDLHAEIHDIVQQTNVLFNASLAERITRRVIEADERRRRSQGS